MRTTLTCAHTQNPPKERGYTRYSDVVTPKSDRFWTVYLLTYLLVNVCDLKLHFKARGGHRAGMKLLSGQRDGQGKAPRSNGSDFPFSAIRPISRGAKGTPNPNKCTHLGEKFQQIDEMTTSYLDNYWGRNENSFDLDMRAAPGAQIR